MSLDLILVENFYYLLPNSSIKSHTSVLDVLVIRTFRI